MGANVRFWVWLKLSFLLLVESGVPSWILLPMSSGTTGRKVNGRGAAACKVVNGEVFAAGAAKLFAVGSTLLLKGLLD